MTYLDPAPFTVQNIAVASFRPPTTGIWSSGRRLSALWALATLGPDAVAGRLRALAAHRGRLQMAAAPLLVEGGVPPNVALARLPGSRDEPPCAGNTWSPVVAVSASALGAAFAEYGRIDKTMHLLALVDPVDDTYRRLMNRQLTVQESRHRLARAICHGGRGQIRQAYCEGQEDQLAALGLVLNAVVLWNTRYLDAAVAQLRAEGHDLKDEDVARLSPLKDRHINFLGRYLFNIKSSGPGHGLRPLRDPDTAEDADDE